jgi:5-methylcytosine-specific restriction endonuclease McrA
LLERGQAVVHRVKPFAIRLKDRVGGEFQPTHLKIDPGSKVTGMAVAVELEDGLKSALLMEIVHRGRQISEALTQRRGYRRRRRNLLWYRPARFNNRAKPLGWLAPSIAHRVDSTMQWVKRLRKLAPVTHIAYEQVKFDMQKMSNPDIAGVQYQRGELFGFEVREYLLHKHNRTCVYCNGVSKDRILEVEHKTPRSVGGGNSIKNLAISCQTCNQAKRNLNPMQWKIKIESKRKHTDLDVARLRGIDKVLSNRWFGLSDAAAVNACRYAIGDRLRQTGLNVHYSTGAVTKFNRKRFGVPKTHALDALCVGIDTKPPSRIDLPTVQVKCMGRGAYQRTRVNASGFPRGYLMRDKRVFGFATGDLVKATVPSGKKTGAYTGRVAVRESGYFNIQTGAEVVQGIGHKFIRLVQRSDGYAYALMPKVEFLTAIPPRPEGRGFSRSN